MVILPVAAAAGTAPPTLAAKAGIGIVWGLALSPQEDSIFFDDSVTHGKSNAVVFFDDLASSTKCNQTANTCTHPHPLHSLSCSFNFGCAT